MGLISDFRKKLALIEEIQKKFDTYCPEILMEIMAVYDRNTCTYDKENPMVDGRKVFRFVDPKTKVIEFRQSNRNVTAILDTPNPSFESFHITTNTQYYRNSSGIALSKREWLFQSISQLERFNDMLRTYPQYLDYVGEERKRVSETYKKGATFRDRNEHRFLLVTGEPDMASVNPNHWHIPTSVYHSDTPMYGTIRDASPNTYMNTKRVSARLVRNTVTEIFRDRIDEIRNDIETAHKKCEDTCKQEKAEHDEYVERCENTIRDFEARIKDINDLLNDHEPEEIGQESQN